MKKLMDKLERLTLAATYAEANDHQTALYFLRSQPAKEQKVQRKQRSDKKLQQEQQQQDLRL